VRVATQLAAGFGDDGMAFRKTRDREMNVRIDDDMLGRLVSYEVHVKKRFARVAQSRWLDFNVDAEQDYEKLKELKSRITMTDRKFNRMRPSMARVLGLETRSAKEG
jgi:hypothetical protein